MFIYCVKNAEKKIIYEDTYTSIFFSSVDYKIFNHLCV